MWLLKNKKGGQTCGHLHVAEVEAWRCRDTQPEPSAWSVASAWLTVKDKRPQQDVWDVVLLWVWVVLAPLGAVLSVILGEAVLGGGFRLRRGPCVLRSGRLLCCGMFPKGDRPAADF